LVAVLVVLGGVGLAGEAPAAPPKPGGEEIKPALTPDEQAAQDIIRRYQMESKVKEDQSRFQSAQHVALGNAHLLNQAWEDARRQYEKGLQLDPNNAEAQDGLRKAKSMLGVERREFGDMAADYARQRAIALEVQKTELNNLFAAAQERFAKGFYVDAVEAFTRVKARANYLSPSLDVAKIAEEAELGIQKAMQAIEEKKTKDEEARLKAAVGELARIRDARTKLFDERTQALFRQATTLFEAGRYDEARKVCDEILLKDPTNGPAQTLRETAVDAGRKMFIDKALKDRRAETESHWQETRAFCVPYTQVRPMMDPARFEEVRSRKAATAIGGDEIKEQDWEKRIKESMNKKISFDFVETPLQDVVAFISNLADVAIVLDADAVKDEPRNVTLRVNDMRLQSALNWVLKLVSLKYTLKDEAVFISKAEKITEKPVLRMYDVTDLTIDIKNFQGRQQALASDSGYSATGSGGYGGGGGDTMAQDFFGTDEDQTKEEDKLTGESLVEFIKKTIAPHSWSDDAAAPDFK
jgi:tetratricopeptide (TPR) repeat protein